MSTDKPDFSNVKSGSSTVSGGGGTAGTPDFSNVRSGSSTVPSGATGVQTHTVEKGDTLSAIAKQFYGKASQWNAIYEANRDQLDDPDKIFPGQVLKIPARDDGH